MTDDHDHRLTSTTAPYISWSRMEKARFDPPDEGYRDEIVVELLPKEDPRVPKVKGEVGLVKLTVHAYRVVGQRGGTGDAVSMPANLWRDMLRRMVDDDSMWEEGTL